VLVNGWRRHQTALVNNFTYGMGAGSSGVDLNAIPASALDRSLRLFGDVRVGEGATVLPRTAPTTR